MSSSGLCGHQTCMLYTDIHVDKPHTQNNKVQKDILTKIKKELAYPFFKMDHFFMGVVDA